MKKNLLTVALLVSFFQSKAQLMAVAPGAVMTVRPGALVYNGGGMRTVGDGRVDNYGNFMIVGSTTVAGDKFETLQATGGPAKLNGNNFNLLYENTSDINSNYGQLYITNIRQSDITGIVDKQYRATSNGSFQQMGIPFFGKKLSGTYTSGLGNDTFLSTDLGTSGFSNLRNTNSIGYHENRRVLVHNLPNTSTTSTIAAADVLATGPTYNNAARYYNVGAANWNPAVLHTIKGVPFSDNSSTTDLVSANNTLTYTLRGAGFTQGGTIPSPTFTPIAYGIGTGNNNNGVYNEQYKTYLQDSFDIAGGIGFFNGTIGTENGNFGRNLYQFANPFLTNIDLTHIGYAEAASPNDGNAITDIQGIRYESIGVVTSNQGATSSTSYKYVTFNTDGTPAGDFDGTLIKPMQAFVIKLRANSTNHQLIFNNLRRFAYTRRTATTSSAVTAAKNGSSQKQLRIIGLDSSGNEIMRTYYVVGSDLATGRTTDVKLQAAAYSGALSTREELPSGGEDTAANSLYWLYINEANETNYLGKKIRMNADLAQITSFKFELAENAEALPNGQSTFANGNNSFYIEQTPGVYTQISHNQVVPATAENSGLYYGMPNSGTLATNETVKDDVLVIAHEDKSNTHQVIFPKSWNKATVTVFDMAGRKVFTQKDINTKSNFILPISQSGAYLVECESEKGVKVAKKIIK